MSDETVTISAAELDEHGRIYVQLGATKPWWRLVMAGERVEVPRRQVRIVTTPDEHLQRLRTALELIGTKCSNFTGRSTCVNSGRTPNAEYGADRWCEQCVAREALAGVRIVTTDPGDERELLDEIASLTQALVDEKAAHAKTRQNFAEYVETEEEELEHLRKQGQPAPAGLSAEQEIRRSAAELHQDLIHHWTLEQTVAWIRDGSVPDAG